MPTMAELKTTTHNASLIRKWLESVALIAAYSETMPEAYFDANQQPLAVPTGFQHLGMTEKESAFTLGNDVSTEEVTAHGYASAVRVDITQTTRTIQSVFQETNRATLEQYYGLDLSAAVTENGIEFNEPELANRPYGRLLLIASDGIGADAWYQIKAYPRVQITGVDSVQIGTGVSGFNLTWTAFPDPELGYSAKHLIGGPGALAALEAMGFTPLTTPEP